MKVLDREAYQPAMPKNASIDCFDMEGGSSSNIILYIRVKKWMDGRAITPLNLHSDNNLKYMFIIVSVDDHCDSKHGTLSGTDYL